MSNEPVPQVERYQAMISQHPDVQTFKKFFQKEENDMGLFGSRRDAAGTIKNKNAGSGEMFVEDWAGSMFLCCSFLVLFLKASFMAKKKHQKKGQGKKLYFGKGIKP